MPAAGSAPAPCPLNKAARTPGLQHHCHLSLAFPLRPGATSGTTWPRAPQRRPAPPTPWGGCGDGIQPPEPTTEQGWRCCAGTEAALQAGELLGWGATATEWHGRDEHCSQTPGAGAKRGGNAQGWAQGLPRGGAFGGAGGGLVLCQPCSTQTRPGMCPPHATPALTTGKLCTQRW